MRRAPGLVTRSHIVIQLAIDDLQLMACEHCAIFVILAKAFIVQQALAPVIRANERKILPWSADLFGQGTLLGSDGGFAGCRGAFDIHHHRAGLRRQSPIALLIYSLLKMRLDQAPNLAAAKSCAYQPCGELSDQIRIRDQTLARRYDALNNFKKGLIAGRNKRLRLRLAPLL